mmetsp:Transcript_50684/g.91256  ORF Transcript_50684/g.91256 Transcript_50684/m.91256 type:complete len:218 (+) Transcript_50684:305-958(+)
MFQTSGSSKMPFVTAVLRLRAHHPRLARESPRNPFATARSAQLVKRAAIRCLRTLRLLRTTLRRPKESYHCCRSLSSAPNISRRLSIVQSFSGILILAWPTAPRWSSEHRWPFFLMVCLIMRLEHGSSQRSSLSATPQSAASVSSSGAGPPTSWELNLLRVPQLRLHPFESLQCRFLLARSQLPSWTASARLFQHATAKNLLGLCLGMKRSAARQPR